MNQSDLDTLGQLLPLLIPLFLVQVGLMVVALVDLTKRERTRGPKWIWVAVIILVNLIGPALYFIVGREES